MHAYKNRTHNIKEIGYLNLPKLFNDSYVCYNAESFPILGPISKMKTQIFLERGRGLNSLILLSVRLLVLTNRD